MAGPQRNLDLHSLECLEALLRERSVSRAAEQVGLSQSAMSEMLARLRERFGDPLLVRARAGMQPTPRAEELRPHLRDVLDRLASLTVDAAAPFDPASCTTRFRLAASDYTQFLFMPPLVATLRSAAPNACIDVLAVNILSVEVALETGDIDCVVAYFLNPPQGLRPAPLFDEQYVWIARRGHPAIGAMTSAETFAALDHLVVAPSGLTYFSGAVDEALAERGLSRRVVVRSPHFLLAAHLVATSDLVLAPSSRAAAQIARYLPVSCRPLPFPTRDIALGLYWHERVHHSVAHRWFRSEVARAVSAPTEGTLGSPSP
jgi:DNA-binding transcriptional LysR family regulator